ncbi:kinase-like protein, partial [Mycena pura]
VRGARISRGTNVYLCLNATTGEMLAVKQFTFNHAAESPGQPSARALKREIQIMQHLTHPNVVECIGFQEILGGDLFLFTEYVSGGSIRDSIQKTGIFGEDAAKSCTFQVLAGLVHLHGRGFVHGELKSSKILVDPTGICKIGGLGCSQTELRDNSRAVPCDIFWTAPEIIRTQYKAYDGKADIWSIGCIVLEMLTGKRPWYDNEAVAVMFKLYNQTLCPRPPADVVLSPVAEDFLERCLALNPVDRMSAVQLRQHPFLVLSPNWSFEGSGPA